MDCNSKTVEQWPQQLHWLIALPTSASLPTPVHLTSRSLHSSSYVLPLISWKLWWMKRPQICNKISEKTWIIYVRIFINSSFVDVNRSCIFWHAIFFLQKNRNSGLDWSLERYLVLMILWPLLHHWILTFLCFILGTPIFSISRACTCLMGAICLLWHLKICCGE